MNQSYLPQPINTSDITLSEELVALTEIIAQQVHEVWAANRMQQGWQYGATRNDVLKQHPCLVPYQDLPEEEREFDRQTAMATLKIVQKNGFKIEKITDKNGQPDLTFNSI